MTNDLEFIGRVEFTKKQQLKLKENKIKNDQPRQARRQRRKLQKRPLSTLKQQEKQREILRQLPRKPGKLK